MGVQNTIKVSKNEAIIKDNPFSGLMGEKTMSYIKARSDQMTYTAETNQINPVQIYIQMDENVQTIQREVYTVTDALSATGGFLEIIAIIVTFLIGGLQETLFKLSIVRKLYIEE